MMDMQAHTEWNNTEQVAAPLPEEQAHPYNDAQPVEQLAPVPQAPEALSLLADNNHPLTQPAEAVPEAPAFEQAEAAPAPIAMEQPTFGATPESHQSLSASVAALEAENAQLKAQLSELEGLKAKEMKLNEASGKLQEVIAFMQG
jgi:hypothetical protein